MTPDVIRDSTYSNKFPKKGVVKAEKEEDTFFQIKT
jgi:hypothetical protein